MKIDEAKELIEKLQDLSQKFKNDVPSEYIDMIDTIWCNLQDDVEYEEEKIEDEEEKIEDEQEKQPNYYSNNYEMYIREVR